MNRKVYFITLFSVYILLSIPAMLGNGYVIDWVPEATVFQKVKGYVGEGLLSNFLLKFVVANLVAILVSFGVFKKRTV